jgi:ABC-type glycerol-3-phosphate transport system permease component
MIATARSRVVLVAALAAAAAVFLLPQLWLFSLSLKNKAGIYEYPPRWIPAGGSLANYRFALTHTQVPWYLWNSTVVAIAAAAGPTCCRESVSLDGRR